MKTFEFDAVLTRFERHAARHGSGPQGLISACRRFLTVETRLLKRLHRAGASGVEIVRGRAQLIDALVHHVCRTWLTRLRLDGAERDQPFALVATGGYGRGELCPHSDVDVLFLASGRLTRLTTAASTKILQTLWDTGCHVSHAVRTVSGCVKLATRDQRTKTSLLDMRLVCGSPAVFEEARSRLEESSFHRRPADFVRARLACRLDRGRRFGDAVLTQEPNVKESLGGLRDIAAVVWIGRVKFGCESLEDLYRAGYLLPHEMQLLGEARDFFFRVRNELHFLADRPLDVLDLHYRSPVAQALGFRADDAFSAAERFMRRFLLKARTVNQIVHTLIERWQLAPASGRATRRRRRRRDGFVLDGTVLRAERPTLFQEDPPRLLRLFALAQQWNATPGAELQALVRAHLGRVDEEFRRDRAIGQQFTALLQHLGRVGSALRQMHDCGLLGRYLPPFDRLTCLVQHDVFHKYTIDEHTLRAIRAIDDLIDARHPGRGLFRKMLLSLRRPIVLVLALLFHDMGKAQGWRHAEVGAAIAQRTLRHLPVPQEVIEEVSFLVQHHLAMAHTAFRRDLSDSKVVVDFAGLVRKLETLKGLLLLTYADICSTGPDLWTDWKESLLWELYERTRAQLRHRGEVQTQSRIVQRKEAIRALLERDFDEQTLDQHLGQLPDRLFISLPPPAIGRLVRLVQRFAGQTVLTDWAYDPTGHVWDVAVCTTDRHGLFSQITGSLAAEEINILSAQINTVPTGVALDIFRVSEFAGRTRIDERVIADVNATLQTVLSDAARVEDLIASRRRAPRGRLRHAKAPEIRFLDAVSDTHTLIEVSASDRVGLLYDITHTLSGCGLEIHSAVISTDRSRALDVFYVTDAQKNKLDDRHAQHIVRQALREVLTPK